MIEMLKNTAAAVTAIVALGGVAWGFGEATGYRPWLKLEQDKFTRSEFQLVMDQSQQNTRALTQFKFEELWGLRKLGELTWDQKMSLCSYALTLNYDVIDDENRAVCSDKGTPILTYESKAK